VTEVMGALKKAKKDLGIWASKLSVWWTSSCQRSQFAVHLSICGRCWNRSGHLCFNLPNLQTSCHNLPSSPSAPKTYWPYVFCGFFQQDPLSRTFLIDVDASPKFRSYMEDRVMCMTKSRPSGCPAWD
jgi:hypothetical protein